MNNKIKIVAMLLVIHITHLEANPLLRAGRMALTAAKNYKQSIVTDKHAPFKAAGGIVGGCAGAYVGTCLLLFAVVSGPNEITDALPNKVVDGALNALIPTASALGAAVGGGRVGVVSFGISAAFLYAAGNYKYKKREERMNADQQAVAQLYAQFQEEKLKTSNQDENEKAWMKYQEAKNEIERKYTSDYHGWHTYRDE